MAKARRQKVKEAAECVRPTRPQRVAAAVESIKAFWRVGRGLTPPQDRGQAYRAKTNRTEAEKTGINTDTVGKGRRFAAEYGDVELEELCRMIEKGQTDRNPKTGRPRSVFGPTHVIRLLSVEGQQAWRLLLRRAVREGWSTAELEREIAALREPRPSGGRNRHVPEDAAGQLVQAAKMCDSWVRWADAVVDRRAKHPSHFPVGVQKLVNKATTAMKNLLAALRPKKKG
jgi:hypothetical protein